MIDILSEKPIPLRQAAAHFPGQHEGKTLSYETLLRWAKTGMRGHKLETVRFGGSLRTSLQAVVRFVARLSADEADVDTSIDEFKEYQQRAAQTREKLRSKFGI